MCCFSGSVRHVAKTRIFARSMGDETQALVYAMTFAAEADVAMILPLPTPPGAPDDALRFVDLSAYPKLFDDLQAGFPVSGYAPQGFGPPLRAPALEVHRVGAFEVLYGQPVTPPPQPWWSTMIPASRHVDVARAQGLVDPDVPVQSRTIVGPQRNEDVLIPA